MEALRFIYSTLLQERNKKERFDMILEPLQAIIQLALLSVYPTGTKLSILNNILHIQEPGWNQGVVRSYYYDTKDDLNVLTPMFLLGTKSDIHFLTAAEETPFWLLPHSFFCKNKDFLLYVLYEYFNNLHNLLLRPDKAALFNIYDIGL